MSQWLAATALLGGCERAPETAPAPPTPTETLIRHNDGTAQRLPAGAAVRFPGTLLLDFEHGARVDNFRPRLPPPGVPISGSDPDFVCADLDVDMRRWNDLMPLSGRTVTVTGMVAANPSPGGCPIRLDRVRVVPR